MKKRDIRDVKRQHAPELMTLPRVVGVGLGEEKGEEVLRVYLRPECQTAPPAIPGWIEGYRVVVVVTGSIRAGSV